MITLSDAQYNQVKQTVLQHGGMLPIEPLQNFLAALDCTIDQFMVALLPLASDLAVNPISNFKAGAVALGETGNLYLAANHEFSHVALNQAIHAEQAVVAVAHHHGETNLEKIAINANPCGHCRQFLFELADGGNLEILVKDAEPTSLAKLLPHAFGPQDLQIDGGLLTPQQHTLQLTSNTTDKLINAALHAATQSYAPYSKAYSGFAFSTRDGKVYAGSYLENVAFNPSLPAIQSALVNLAMHGCRYEDVVAAALVQVKNNIVNHEASTQMVLTALCPNVMLQIGEG